MSESKPTSESPTSIVEGPRTLPIGILHQKVHLQDISFQPPRGRMRKAIAKETDPNNQLLVGLSHVVSSLGPIRGPGQSILGRLTLEDLHYLNLCLWYDLKGHEMEIEEQCQNCNHVHKDTVDVRQVTFRTVEDPAPVMVDENGAFVEGIYHGASQDRKIRLKLLTLSDLTRLQGEARRRKLSWLESMQFFQLRSITELDGKPFKPASVDDWPADEFDALLFGIQDLSVRIPGVDVDIELTCPKCFETIQTRFETSDWLRPTRPRRQS